MFDALLRQGELPDSLVFTPAVHRQFARLWRRSVESQNEWGVTLCLDKAGKMHCRRARAGTAKGFVPDLRVRRGERLLGVYHTHVYASGETGMAFSDLDFAEFVMRSNIPLFIVQSGDALFALVRTPQTVIALPPDFLSGQFYTKIADIQESDITLSYEESLWLANLHFAEAFGCALYRGRLFQPLKGVFRP